MRQAATERIMRPLVLEVIVQSVADARAAAAGGADRLEVVRAIRQGGLTPPLSLVREIAAETALPLRVMVRENGGYATNPRELTVLRRAAAEFANAGVDGMVMGFAHAGALALEDVGRVLAAAPTLRATFHRAFDALRDPLRAIDLLAEVPQIDSILTDGGGETPARRCERLREYALRAGTRLTIIAGSGVTDEVLAAFAQAGCVREVHVGRAAREGGDPEGLVSAARVQRLRQLADGGPSS
jgi:copper homeostasis protein